MNTFIYAYRLYDFYKDNKNIQLLEIASKIILYSLESISKIDFRFFLF